jgi:hypothetical protein
MMQTTFMTSFLIFFYVNSIQWIVQFGDVHISLPILGISGSGHNFILFLKKIVCSQSGYHPQEDVKNVAIIFGKI